ncbi:transcription factor E3 [Dermacentor silvarum]|uniref:transcription factor E3 n=1 Tax=Dermacentor silvarum TaxID=543639 RepID=UPI0018995CE5|nr:transcription factor E3 [Dermacentor silvarum]
MSQLSKESGVDLNFDEIMASSLTLQDTTPYSFYEVKDRTVVPSLPPQCASGAGRGGAGGSTGGIVHSRPPVSRTNLKQQLQRHQAEQEERRLRELLGAPRQPSSAICVPGVPDTIPDNIQVPTQVLQVQSRLENPTRYHVEQSKRRQVKQYLTGSQPLSRPQLQHVASSAPGEAFSPDSPASLPHSGSAATSNSEFEDAFDDLSHFDGEDFLSSLGAGQGGHATVPSSLVEFEEVWPGGGAKAGAVSSSCPPDLALVKEEELLENDLRALAKDRQKKDNHNMIERRRRFNINDRIKELGTLLPRTNDRHYELVRDIRQNKGTILKATVDYVRTLKKENDRIPLVEEKQRTLEQQNRQLLLRIQELEQTMQMHGIQLTSQTWHPTSESQLSALINDGPTSFNDLYDFKGGQEDLKPDDFRADEFQHDAYDIKHEAPSPSPSSGLSSAPSPGHNLGHYDDTIMDDDPMGGGGDPLLSASHLPHEKLNSPGTMDYHG